MGAENYFGLTLAAVRKYMPRPRFVIRQDTRFVNGAAIRENVRFARFSSMEESFDIYAKYLTGSLLYQNAFKHTNSPELFARELARYYAADKDYALKLITLMRRYQLNGE